MKSVNLAVSVILALAAFPASASIEPVDPVGGRTVQRVADAQKTVMSLPTLEERIRLFVEDRKSGKKIRHDPYWRRPLPLVLTLKTTRGENGPWKVLIGKRPDLSDAQVWYVSASKTDKATGREDKAEKSGGRVRFEVPRANLEIATTYYWKVFCRGRCGFGCGPNHHCKESRKVVETPVSSFVTEDFAPRWMEVEGKVGNFRDLGGRMGKDGRRVRQGMIYRGQGLNENSVTGEVQGRNRLTVEDVKYLTGTLGIRTDLDLRGPGEIADLRESPLGPDVKLIRRDRSSACYKGIFEAEGRKLMAMNFREFCRRDRYPVYFHCIGGADRAGSLAYVLNGILGVSRHDLETDWESTFYPRIPDEDPDPDFWCRESHFSNGFAKYGAEGDSWTRRIELYLLDCGVTAEEIEEFRGIMLAD